MTDYRNRREYFRLRYPPSMLGTVEIKKTRYPLVELSVKGLRIECDREFRHFQRVAGQIIAEDGTPIDFEGRYDRRQRDQVVLVDVVGVHPAYVISEEIRLMKYFLR